ncbi:MAG TPA: hypothetical protein PK158_07910 [Spirochaetota bacterium]|nr:hypothetical protein [Spirochaetota bacterium]
MKILLSALFICLSIPVLCSDTAVADDFAVVDSSESTEIAGKKNDAETKNETAAKKDIGAEKETDVIKEVGKLKEDTKTLLNMTNLSLSGYGAPVVRFSKMGDSYSTLVGGRGGLIINDNFVLGGCGMGLVHPRDRSDFSGITYSGNYDRVDFAYGGGLIEYYFTPKSLFGFSAGATIGGGGLTFHSRKEAYDEDEYGSDVFFVAEPEVNIFVNITKFCRIGAGISYRYVKGIGVDEFDDKDFRGPSIGIIVALGWF